MLQCDNVFLSLGTNLGDRQHNLVQCYRLLSVHGLEPRGYSSIWETEPVGVDSEQPWFYNCVVRIATQHSPEQVLLHCKEIETALGRTTPSHRQPRVADLDILLYGQHCCALAHLVIPHPALLDRRFCIEGLAQVAPDCRIPGSQWCAAEALAAMPEKIRNQVMTPVPMQLSG